MPLWKNDEQIEAWGNVPFSLTTTTTYSKSRQPCLYNEFRLFLFLIFERCPGGVPAARTCFPALVWSIDAVFVVDSHCATQVRFRSCVRGGALCPRDQSHDEIRILGRFQGGSQAGYQGRAAKQRTLPADVLLEVEKCRVTAWRPERTVVASAKKPRFDVNMDQAFFEFLSKETDG